MLKPMGALIAFATLLGSSAAPSRSAVATDWYVQASGTGDGRSAERPAGTLASIERLSAAGDRIFVLPSEALLDGGIALKAGQRLIGVAQDGRKPRLTNTDSSRHLGCGVLLASGTTVSNLRVEATLASGIYGVDVSDVRIDSVDVSDANRAQGFIAATYPTLPGRVPHGGMVFVHTRGPADIAVTASTVTATAGMGIATHASGAAQTRLSIQSTRVEGGSRIGFYDIGVAVLAQDAQATSRLELSDSRVQGRLSRSGRNVMITASGGARAEARIERSYSGATGQDGIVGAARQSPSAVRMQIINSVVEDAGQMNIEGTLINLPAAAGAEAGNARMEIEIDGSTIRRAGAVRGFEDVAANVWMGGTQFVADAPPAVGHYTLRITNSRIDSAGRSGLEFGNRRITAAGMTEPNVFDVSIRGSRIGHNGEADIKIAARGARIDARQNCWGQPTGLDERRVLILAPAARAQLDAREPRSCE
jgi:hypothetical protein